MLNSHAMSGIRINKITLYLALSVDSSLERSYNSRMKKGTQLCLTFRDHGGFRKKAGRERQLASDPKHCKREHIDAKIPAHIKIKLIEQTPCLRTPNFIREFTRAVKRAQIFGLRIQHFTIESNHIHFIAEADHNDAMTAGMISLNFHCLGAS